MTYSTASFLLRKHGTEGVRNLLSNFRQFSHVATTNERTVDDSLASRFKDFEDAMQYYTAVRAKADIIITRNGKDFTASKLPVMTATEYLATLEGNKSGVIVWIKFKNWIRPKVLIMRISNGFFLIGIGGELKSNP